MGLDRFEKSVKNAECGYLTHDVNPIIHRETQNFGFQVDLVGATSGRCEDANVALLMRLSNFLLGVAWVLHALF